MEPGEGGITESELRLLLEGLTAVRDGDFRTRLPDAAEGLLGEIATVFNGMVNQLSLFTSEVTRVAREVGTEGTLGGQADVPGVGGAWLDLTDSVNFMAGNLTDQVRNIAQVTTAVAQGDLSQKITVDARGEILELKNTINTMVDQLSSFAGEVTRVAREVGTEGLLGGQADVKDVSGTWRDLTDSVNFMAGNLTAQVRSIAQVATAVAQGDLSQKITVTARGEILELKTTINTMVDQLSAFADEVTRVAREVGTEGNLGGQATVRGVSGTWKDLTDNVNVMASNLTGQVRSIAQVATAVARGDLSQKITVEAKGEVAVPRRESSHHGGTPLSAFRRRGDARGPRGRHRGPPGRPGTRAQRGGHLEEPHRERQRARGQPHPAGPGHRRRHQRRRRGRPHPLHHRGSPRRGRRPQGQHQLHGRLTAGDHPRQPGAGLAQVQPRPHLRPDAGPPRPGRRRRTRHGRADPPGRRPVRRLLPGGGHPRGHGADARRLLRPLRRRRGRRPLRPRRVPRRTGGPQPPDHHHRPGPRRLRHLLRARPHHARKPDDPADHRGRPGPRRDRTRLLLLLHPRPPRLPRPVAGDHRRQRQHHRRERPHRRTPGRVPAPDRRTPGTLRRTPGPAGGAAALQRGTGGEGRPAGQPEPRHRGEEPADRTRPAGTGGPRPAVVAGLQVQVGVPGEHEPRTAHPAQQPADPRAAAGPEPHPQPHLEAGRVRRHHPLGRIRPPPADQRHPRPLQGRGGQDGHPPRAGPPATAAGLRRGHLPAHDHAEEPRLHRHHCPRRPRRPADRRLPAAPGPAQPAVQRGQVHRARRRRAAHRTGHRRRSPRPAAPPGERDGLPRPRHRHRHPRTAAGIRVRSLPAGRRDHQPQVRGHRARPLHHP
ncbi:predicted protein [Streptomyces sp. C]|nr:predicted protein [Streptomyces sp. C]